MLSLTVLSAPIDSLYDNSPEAQHSVPSTHYFTKMLELYEIANHIMLSQVSVSSNFADSLGLPRLYQKDEYFGTALQLDLCLNKWEKNIPPSLRPDIFRADADDVSHKQGVLLRLR